MASFNYFESVWLGLHDLSLEQRFKWISGKCVVSFTTSKVLYFNIHLNKHAVASVLIFKKNLVKTQ